MSPPMSVNLGQPHPSGPLMGDELSVPASGRVFAAEVSPGPSPPVLLALGLRSSISVLQLAFPEEQEASSEGDRQFRAFLLREVNHDGRVHCLAWSPRQPGQDLSSSSSVLVLATGGADGKVRVFRLVLSGGTAGEGEDEQDRVLTLGGHTDYVNAVAFQPNNSTELSRSPGLLASASDDCSLILHRLDGADHGEPSGDRRHVITFGSPVMAVKWHPGEEAKLMTAERSGTVHILNSVSFSPIQSLDCGLGPLSSADWNPKNSLLIAAAIRSEIYVWDLSRPPAPVVRRTLHEEGVRAVRFAGASEAVVATNGQPNYGVKVFNAKSGQVLLSASEKPVGGIAWHPRLPYLVIGRDQSVTIHHVRM